MKARKKGTDTWLDVERVQLSNSSILFKTDVLEFDIPDDSNDDDKYWQEVREKAAIAAMKAIISKDYYKAFDLVASSAVTCADALVEELKRK